MKHPKSTEENFFDKYLKRLRAQPKEAQRIHAFSISGIITMIIAVLWLHFHYGFWTGGAYIKEEKYETQVLTDYDGKTPTLVLRDFFTDAKNEISRIFSGVPAFFTGSSTFERPH